MLGLRRRIAFAVLGGSLLLAACSSSSSSPAPSPANVLPVFIAGPVARVAYDGTSDDLLTGGLGKTGLASAVAPGFADPVHPTPVELRRRNIYVNYRALVDTSALGGYGTMYGPNVDPSGVASASEGKIAGEEWIAFADDGTGAENVAMMVQIPATFDPAHPCIVSGTSSGSRGVYGAIGTAGEWGLKRGCAVAYTDKGTGNGAHDLQTNVVTLIDGRAQDAEIAGKASSFTAAVTPGELVAYSDRWPNRFAFKHAHSQQNPERNWGRDTLRAISFAFWAINEKHGNHVKTFTERNTIVIASSVSNGGAAALAAAEQDTEGLVSGVVAGEPQVQLGPNPARVVMRGGTPVAANGKTMLDYATVANLYQPCAALSSTVSAAPFLASVNAARATNRCVALYAAGLLSPAATTTAAQADESLAKLHDAGWEADSDLLHPTLYAFATPAIAVTYANQYGRFSVLDNLCGFSFGVTDPTGVPTTAAATVMAQVWATGNGIPPTAPINLINNESSGGPLKDDLSINPVSGLQDYNLDGARCLRDLFTGVGPGGSFARAGNAEVLRSADLRGLPAILVQGRNDGLVPVNHASRAYVAENRLREGAASNVRYYEIANGQHFDAFIDALPGYAARFVPVHRYFLQSMDLMYDHLRNGAPLPPSQVVRTTPRGADSTPLSPSNVPPISPTPAGADAIVFDGDALSVPN